MKKKAVPVIGIHRPYYNQKSYGKLNPVEAKKQYKTLERAVRYYMDEMGAPRTIVDRMFRSASSEVDLVPSKEFQGFFHNKEPFLDEWLIAKCGSKSDGKDLLSTEDYQYQKLVWDERAKEVKRRTKAYGGGPEDYTEVYQNYVPKGFSKERYDQIISVVRHHNWKQQDCVATAVNIHQSEMALSLIVE